MASVEHLVIGAGISGLGIAQYAARRGIQTQVLEATERIGGCIQTLAFSQGFWVEAGAHTGFNSYGNLLDLLDALGENRRLLPKEKRRYRLWAGARHRSLLSALHPLELAYSLPRSLVAKKAGRRVADYYSQILGRRNYRDLFRYAFRAVICQDADDFPAELLFRPKPRRKEVIRSFTLEGGLSEIPQALARTLVVQTGRRARTITRRRGKGFSVALEDGEEIACDFLSLAVPPDVAQALLADAYRELADSIREIAMTEVDTLVLCVPAEALEALPPLAGLISREESLYSMVSRDYRPHERFRGFSFHFRRGALGPDQQVDRACAALGIPREAIAGTRRVHNRLPALRVDHEARIQRLDAGLQGHPLALTGNWFLGVSLEDCLTRSYRESRRLFGPD